MQKTFHFIRSNGQLTRITEEEYQIYLDYQVIREMDTDESDMWREYYGLGYDES